MDLVDIDKVLDDFELNEDQSYGATTIQHSVPQLVSKSSPSEPILIPKSEVSNKEHLDDGHDVKNDENIEDSEIAVNSRKASGRTGNSSSTSATTTTTTAKSFVNVSNVFHSLSEYVNASIPTDTISSSVAKFPKYNPEETAAVTFPSVADNHPEPLTLPPIIPTSSETGAASIAFEDTTEKIDDPSEIVHSASTSSSSSPSSPMLNLEKSKFVFDNSTTSGSIISSSSVSSTSSTSLTRSSDGIGVTNDNDCASLSQQLIPSVSNDDPVSNEEPPNDMSKISDNGVPSSVLMTMTTSYDVDEDEYKDDHLALSSVSSFCLNGNNHSSASVTSDSNDEILMIDGMTSSLSSMPAPLATDDTLSTVPKKVADNVPAPAVFPADVTKPIGFESTMDDVSDTELESYLQDLELEPSLNQALNDIESLPISCYETVSQQQTDSDEVISSPMTVPIQNADSFSQASTVEFADQRLQSDFEAIPVELTCVNSSSILCGQDDAKDYEQPFQRPNSLDLPSSHHESLTADITPFEHAPPPPHKEPMPILTSETCTSEVQSPQPEVQSELADDEIMDATVEPGQMSTSSSQEEFPSSYQGPDDDEPTAAYATGSLTSSSTSTQLGKIQPYWIPDNVTNFCMQCNLKFSLIKRRHHCRACGQVLCSACCSLKAKLEYMGEMEARICVQCDITLNAAGTASGEAQETGGGSTPVRSLPNPNNPMEYCSLIPPLQQAAGAGQSSPISVMVPVGVLKREGAPKSKRSDKTVMFSDGIRPGCDLTDLDNNWDGGKPSNKKGGTSKRVQTPPGNELTSSELANQKRSGKNKVKLPPIDEENQSFIPKEEHSLPPIYKATVTEFRFIDAYNDAKLIQTLHNETLKFAIQRNFYVLVKIIKLSCCINKTVINFTTQGLHHVGQDEIVILLEMNDSNRLPKHIFLHLNEIYMEANKGTTITELGFSMPNTSNFLGSKEHGGFLYIRSTFQCLQGVNVPENPFLIGILIHRWEVPWAKIFPLRLMLRLGALYRYYPCPHVSVRGRDSVYAEIAQTIINFLADFRTYSYTLATIRGMYIHMEDRTTSVLIPQNRYDEVMKAMVNSSDHILALGGNFSKKADGHLVCIQNTESGCSETHSYSTQAVNIQGRPRKVTGASFFVLNGALKTTSGLSGKCSIVEDGLMVQILPAKMIAVHKALKEMKPIEIVCGPIDGDVTQTEVVSIQWTDNDTEFNVGVLSPIDNKSMTGIPSIRVHRGLNMTNSNHIIRWTEVFIIQSDDDSVHNKDPIDMSKLSEQIARSASMALVSFLDLLAASGLTKIGLRTTLHLENVCYEAGSQNTKLGPLYMNALDNELIPTLHRQATNLHIETPIVIELIFHILDE